MKTLRIITCIFVTIGIISLILFNIYTDGSVFLKISIGQVLTLFVAIYFAFYLTQRNDDLRMRKEVYKKILEEVQEIAENRENYEISENTDMDRLKMTKRSLSNYSEMIKRYSKDLNVDYQVNKICGHVDEYINLLGNHIDDKEYLSKSTSDLFRPLELINNEVIEAMIELYK